MADDKNSLAARLNRMAQQKKAEQTATEEVKLNQEQVNQFVFANARSEYERLLGLLDARVKEINPSLSEVPRFEFNRNGPYVKQGNFAVYLAYSQLYLNAGPIRLRLSFGREPEGFYMDFESGAPAPDRYDLEPAMESSPDRIVWIGDLAPLPNGIASEELADFALQHLTEYYLEHQPRRR